METPRDAYAAVVRHLEVVRVNYTWLENRYREQAEQIKIKDEAIRAALRIKTLWLCPTPGDGPEVEDECRALVVMAQRLEQALKG